MRKKILEKAREVFNSKGIQQATIRDIAAELSLSDGHVRYYFKTKETLLLAVFDQMNEEILKWRTRIAPHDSVLENLRVSLENTYATMYEYSFFFFESLHSLKQFPLLFESYSKLIAERKLLLKEVFGELRQCQIFKPEITDEALNTLFEQFFILSDGWIRFQYLQGGTFLPKDFAHYSAITLQLFNPYLSDNTSDIGQ